MTEGYGEESDRKRSLEILTSVESAYKKERDAHCDFEASMAAAGDGQEGRRLLCSIELNERQEKELEALRDMRSNKTEDAAEKSYWLVSKMKPTNWKLLPPCEVPPGAQENSTGSVSVEIVRHELEIRLARFEHGLKPVDAETPDRTRKLIMSLRDPEPDYNLQVRTWKDGSELHGQYRLPTGQVLACFSATMVPRTRQMENGRPVEHGH